MWMLVALLVGALIGVSYLEKHKKENVEMNKGETPVSADIGKTENDDEKNSQMEKGIYEDPIAVQLAEECKDGNASSMRKMAELLRNHCEADVKERLDQYEAEPTPEHESAIREHAISNMGEGYMMWLIRAAMYGDERASEKIDKCPIYKELAFIPYNIMLGKGKPNFISYWNSSSLYDIGFIDVPKECTDCRLSYDADKRIFNLNYVSDYEPYDEYGFGAEWYYRDIYFDEFLRRLSNNARNYKDSEG